MFLLGFITVVLNREESLYEFLILLILALIFAVSLLYGTLIRLVRGPHDNERWTLILPLPSLALLFFLLGGYVLARYRWNMEAVVYVVFIGSFLVPIVAAGASIGYGCGELVSRRSTSQTPRQ